jgi:hypothetical protein
MAKSLLAMKVLPGGVGYVVASMLLTSILLLASWSLPCWLAGFYIFNTNCAEFLRVASFLIAL